MEDLKPIYQNQRTAAELVSKAWAIAANVCLNGEGCDRFIPKRLGSGHSLWYLKW